jgi:hypothetical protein
MYDLNSCCICFLVKNKKDYQNGSQLFGEYRNLAGELLNRIIKYIRTANDNIGLTIEQRVIA